MLKKFITLIVAAFMLLSPVVLTGIATIGLVGCKAVTPQRNVYNTLSLTARSVDSAMQTYAMAVVAGKVNEEKQAEIKEIYTKYQALMYNTIIVAKIDMNAATPNQIQEVADALINTIITLGK